MTRYNPGPIRTSEDVVLYPFGTEPKPKPSSRKLNCYRSHKYLRTQLGNYWLIDCEESPPDLINEGGFIDCGIAIPDKIANGLRPAPRHIEMGANTQYIVEDVDEVIETVPEE